MSLPSPQHWPPPRPETRRGELPPPPGAVVRSARGPRRRAPDELQRVRTVLLTTFSAVVSLFTVVLSWDAEGSDVFFALLGLCAGGGVAFLVTRRASSPGLLALASVVFSLALRGDVVGSLVGTTVLVRRGRWRDAALASVGTAAALSLSLVRDSRQPLTERIWATRLADGTYAFLTTPGIVAFVAVVVALPLVVGYVQRQQRAAREATQVTHATRAEADGLLGRLGQVEERELLAREIHDTVAHRLSLLSLHAAALERASDDPDLAELAAAVRADAHGSLDEMRDLITLMRTPGGLEAAQEARRPVTPGALGQLVEESRHASGVPASFTLMLDDSTSMPAPTARAAHRVLQEALTNARKHGRAGAGEASVVGGPRTGVRLTVSNPVAAVPGAVPGAGRGLEGVRERVSLLGGTVTTSVENGVHTLEAWLPWSPPPSPAPASPTD